MHSIHPTMSSSTTSDPNTTTPPFFPWHHLPHIFPTAHLPQRFSGRRQSPPHLHSKEAGEEIRTLQDADKKCPLYELVQYKCEVDMGPDKDGKGEGELKIRCRPVVRLFRK